ncbi:MAG: hypothetical protein PVI38_14645 [Desulfobacterales bacterium]|jgi:hypothetical protein
MTIACWIIIEFLLTRTLFDYEMSTTIKQEAIMVFEMDKKKSAVLTLRIGVVLLVILFIVVLGPGLLDLDSSQALAKKKGGRFCSQTATAAYKACLNETQDDYNIAVGNCINVSDGGERADCYREAKADRREAIRECKDQRAARRDVCEDLGQDRYDPTLDPADFVADPLQIGGAVAPNPYWPLVPGTTWTYENEEGGETIIVEVLDEIKEIEYPADSGQFFNCIVVNDVVTDTDGGDVIEDTLDWYAQDLDGNVWYFGEIAQNFEDGELVDIEGSWTAGVDGAKPGILMWAYDRFGSDPPQEVYRQEFFLGDAEDIGEFVEWVDSIEIRGRTYTNVLKTKDYTPIEPDVFEFKYYAPGVGLILEEAYEDDVPTGETVELDSSSLPLP